MSTNKFEGFFDDPNHPQISKHEPTMQQLVEAMAVMCSQVHDWYTKPLLRMMAHGASQKIANKIQEAVNRGERPDFHPGWAAFMMLVQERLMTSYEKYADDAEREAFPFFPEEMDPPSD
jgi:hypothetical protein